MNAQDERHHVLRERVVDWRKEGLIDEAQRRAAEESLRTSWRSYGVVVQCVFFLLTLIGMLATYGLTYLANVPKRGLAIGLLFVVVAELLIRKQRWFGTGVEAALWIGGVISMITELPSSGKPEAWLVIGAAFGVTGLRVRNPIFGAVAAICVMVYMEKRFDLGVITALVLAVVALLALLRTWKRPSTEWLWIALALTLPIAGRVEADEKWRTMTIALYAGFGMIAIALAILKRHHALYLSGMIGLAIAAGDLANTSKAPAEAKIAAAGVLLLAIAFVISRTLRSRTIGLVVTPAKLTPFDDALTYAGTLAAQHAMGGSHAHAEPVEPVRAEGGGGFGGGGASGDY